MYVCVCVRVGVHVHGALQISIQSSDQQAFIEPLLTRI